MKMTHCLSIDVGLIILWMLYQNGIALYIGGVSDRQKVLAVSIGKI